MTTYNKRDFDKQRQELEKDERALNEFLEGFDNIPFCPDKFEIDHRGKVVAMFSGVAWEYVEGAYLHEFGNKSEWRLQLKQEVRFLEASDVRRFSENLRRWADLLDVFNERLKR